MKEVYFEIATQFREAIITALHNGQIHGSLLFKFPQGSCGYASELLQRYLHESGIESSYVTGSFDDGIPDNFESHTWLLTDDGFIIDITGDQYSFKTHMLEYNIPVYVGKTDSFHSLFEITGITRYCDNTSPLGRSKLEMDKDHDYSVIKQYL